MAGHSKWHNIRHKKAAVDAQKAKKFTKLNKEISIAAREKGGNPEHNPQLRVLLQKAKRINMPQENVTRAIKKGTGELPGVHYEPHMYEGYGPNGIAVIIDVLTDNKNRAISEIRHFFNKHGGSIAEAGAVSWMFQRRGVIQAHHDTFTEDDIMTYVLDYDVYDITHDSGAWYITCSPQALDTVRTTLHDAGMHIDEAQVRWLAQHQQTLDAGKAEQAAQFLSELEHLDDVQELYTNLAQQEESL